MREHVSVPCCIKVDKVLACSVQWIKDATQWSVMTLLRTAGKVRVLCTSVAERHGPYNVGWRPAYRLLAAELHACSTSTCTLGIMCDVCEMSVPAASTQWSRVQSYWWFSACMMWARVPGWRDIADIRTNNSPRPIKAWLDVLWSR